MTTTSTPELGIAAVAERTGLSQDALRWYEREGLIPPVPRTPSGRRTYDDAAVRMVQLVVRLRRTGMPIAQVKEFCVMVGEGAATHGRRMSLLLEHRVRLLEQQAQLRDDLAAVDHKISHYEDLIERGLDCAETPVTDPGIRSQQRRFA